MSSFETAAILSTGTEILQGLYADTNARYLAEQLSGLGIEVKLIAAAPDNEQEFEKTLSHLGQRVDLVICTGGLGPTEDDVNRYVFSRLLGCELIVDQRSLDMMRERFQKRGRGAMPASNEVQALILSGAQVLYNDWGTAPGFYLGQDHKRPGFPAALIALPGPPREMESIFRRDVLPILSPCVGKGMRCTLIRTLHSFGSPESDINDRCRDLFTSDPQIRLTILAKTYGVDLRLFTTARDHSEAEARLDSMEMAIRSRLSEREIYGIDDTTMQQAVAKLLMERKVTVAAAESCTGGWIAKMLTDVPGSSAYLKQSYVVYSNEAKASVLGVTFETLTAHGAVSEQVARELAENVRRVAGADYGIGVTGIAGPDGGTPEKPVGLTWVGVAGSDKTEVHRYVFMADREQNRRLAALSGLWLLRAQLLDH